MSAVIAPIDSPPIDSPLTLPPPTANESITALLEDATMPRHEQLTSAKALIDAELATIAETHTTEAPTSTALVVVPPAQQQQAIDIDIDIVLDFIMALIKAGSKTPSAKTLAAGFEKCTKPLNERNVKRWRVRSRRASSLLRPPRRQRTK